MINFINNVTDFEKYKKELERFFDCRIPFERNPFKNEFKHFLACEFDFMFNDLFFEKIKIFLTTLAEDRLVYYTIEPPPDDYFYKHFNKYSIFEVDIKTTTDDDLNEIMMKNPGDSPADALALNSNIVVWFSGSTKWAAIASRDLEMLIVGFVSDEIRLKFVKIFKDDLMFASVEKYIDNFSEMITFSTSQKMIYKSIIKSYR